MSFAVIWAFLRSPLAKYIGLALVLGGAIWFGIHRFDQWRDGIREEGRQAGRTEVTREVQSTVIENNRINRNVEQRVNMALGGFVGRLDQTLAQARGQSAQIGRTINNQITQQPGTFDNRQCDTPQETIDARNAIRHLGPPVIAPTTPTPAR